MRSRFFYTVIDDKQNQKSVYERLYRQFRYADNEKEGNLTHCIKDGYSHDGEAAMEYTYNSLIAEGWINDAVAFWEKQMKSY